MQYRSKRQAAHVPSSLAGSTKNNSPSSEAPRESYAASSGQQVSEGVQYACAAASERKNFGHNIANGTAAVESQLK